MASGGRETGFDIGRVLEMMPDSVDIQSHTRVRHMHCPTDGSLQSLICLSRPVSVNICYIRASTRASPVGIRENPRSLACMEYTGKAQHRSQYVWPSMSPSSSRPRMVFHRRVGQGTYAYLSFSEAVAYPPSRASGGGHQGQ